MHGRRSADRQGDQKLILHRQNAIHVDPGKILDEGKKKRAVRVKQMVSIFP
jgi:replication fork protection complex subunit Tof1/Swi1